MTRSPFLRFCGPACALTLTLSLLAAPAGAETGPQIDVYGHVAPRCWVANPANPWSAETIAPHRAICNQATPMIQSSVRALNPDGTLAEMHPTTGPTGRTALEIVISPQL